DPLDSCSVSVTLPRPSFLSTLFPYTTLFRSVSGTKNPASAYVWITLDAFVVQAALPPGTVFEDSSSSVSYSGSWAVWSNSGNSEGSAHHISQLVTSASRFLCSAYVEVEYLKD